MKCPPKGAEHWHASGVCQWFQSCWRYRSAPDLFTRSDNATHTVLGTQHAEGRRGINCFSSCLISYTTLLPPSKSSQDGSARDTPGDAAGSSSRHRAVLPRSRAGLLRVITRLLRLISTTGRSRRRRRARHGSRLHGLGALSRSARRGALDSAGPLRPAGGVVVRHLGRAVGAVARPRGARRGPGLRLLDPGVDGREDGRRGGGSAQLGRDDGQHVLVVQVVALREEAVDVEAAFAGELLGEEGALAHALRVRVEVEGFGAVGGALYLDGLDADAGRDGAVAVGLGLAEGRDVVGVAVACLAGERGLASLGSAQARVEGRVAARPRRTDCWRMMDAV
ncbi:hypothetical protein B0T11DRAFT_142360 [Plectosphaerella cucumerina]|uniref:Uncharacterized protein n=1 Tax=Plectosphaerella cucumerina TaxID=40658 RepID=A0A8K0WXW9_9PEZI|nr:hypothetical protein B0T11DRAFT_142360 [Plectosphaerella cucumerina]